MNLEYLKQLEDLKLQLSQISKKLKQLMDEKINSYKTLSFNEFKNYFSKAGFTVSETSNSALIQSTATYGKTRVKLICENADFMGAYAVFNLSSNIDNAKNLTILLNKNKQGFSITTKSSISESDPNKKLLNEISAIKSKIAETENKISNFSNFQLFFFIKECNDQKFSSMEEILEFLFT